jgi:hypothetical protein
MALLWLATWGHHPDATMDVRVRSEQRMRVGESLLCD